MTLERVYLDHAATSPLRPEARAAMLAALEHYGNPSSIHQEGQAARFMLDEARRRVADMLDVRAERVVFTSGGSESNNLALRGLMAARPDALLLSSAVEHDCVRRTAGALAGRGANTAVIPVNGQGAIDLSAVDNLLHGTQGAVVSVMHANNENGVIQPIADVAALCRAHGAVLHCDAVQTVGHMPVRPDALGVDLLSFSGHKLGAPKGVGVLVVKPELDMHSLIIGGGQERNRRAGTENVPAIAGLGAVVAALDPVDDARRMQALHDQLLGGLSGLPIEIVGHGTPRMPHIVQLLIPGQRGEDVVIGMDLQGVAVSQGSACGSGRTEASYVLQAMGYDEETAGQGVRISFGWNSEPEHVDRLLAVLGRVVSAR